MKPRAAALAVTAAAALAAACGKPERPAVDAATERAQATERARHDVFGTQMKALDKAKALEADINARAAAAVDQAEKNAK